MIVQITFHNQAMLEAQAEKMKDFTLLFQRIRDKWVEHNADKFAHAQGASEMGASFPDGVFWNELSDEYRERKEQQGYDDWLMVRSGDLMRSLTEKGSGWFELIEPMYAMYGTTDPTAAWNFEDRPIMFLDPVDRMNITELVMAFMDDRFPFSARYGIGQDVTYGDPGAMV